MVVHMDEKFSDWSNLISWCRKNKIDYIVGDTNITEKKKKTTAELFFTNLNLSGTFSNREIEKLRQGDSKTNDVNGFLNNQINKGNTGTTEIDGMVILNISSAASSAVDTSPADYPADTIGAAAPAAAADDADGGENKKPSVARRQVRRMGKNFGNFISNLTGRNKQITRGGKRKKKTKKKKK